MKKITSPELIGILELKIKELDEYFPQIKGSANDFLGLLKKSSEATNYSGSLTIEQAQKCVQYLEQHYSKKAKMNEETEKSISEYNEAMKQLGNSVSRFMDSIGTLIETTNTLSEENVKLAYEIHGPPKIKA